MTAHNLVQMLDQFLFDRKGKVRKKDGARPYATQNQQPGDSSPMDMGTLTDLLLNQMDLEDIQWLFSQVPIWLCLGEDYTVVESNNPPKVTHRQTW